MQKALVKNLLIQVDGKELSANERQDMDGLFSMMEYTQLLSVVREISGGDELGKKPQLEVVLCGDQ